VGPGNQLFSISTLPRENAEGRVEERRKSVREGVLAFHSDPRGGRLRSSGGDGRPGGRKAVCAKINSVCSLIALEKDNDTKGQEDGNEKKDRINDAVQQAGCAFASGTGGVKRDTYQLEVHEYCQEKREEERAETEIRKAKELPGG